MKRIHKAFLFTILAALLGGCQNQSGMPTNPQMEGSSHISVEASVHNAASEAAPPYSELIEQIKKADYSSIVGVDEEELERIMASIDIAAEMEWVEGDINGDGSKELIRQRTDSYHDKARMIFVIFAFDNGKTTVVYNRTGSEQMTSSYFLGGNENLMYHYQFHGVIGKDTYYHCTFDSQWNMAKNYGFDVTTIHSGTAPSDLPFNWIEEHPGMTEPGVYYEKLTKNGDGYDSELLTEEQFLEAFDTMSGLSFHDISPSF